MMKTRQETIRSIEMRRLIDKILPLSANNTIVWFDPRRRKKSERRQEQRDHTVFKFEEASSDHLHDAGLSSSSSETI